MAITDRNLKVGTKLAAQYKKQSHQAEVVAGEEGQARYRLADGREFKSPSAAGTAITGKSCNGWAFWSVADDNAAAEGAEASPEVAASGEANAPAAADAAPGIEPAPETEDAEPEAAPALNFRRVANQKGVVAGFVRLYCDACKNSFNAPLGQQPDTCPEGHLPQDGQRPATAE